MIDILIDYVVPFEMSRVVLDTKMTKKFLLTVRLPLMQWLYYISRMRDGKEFHSYLDVERVSEGGEGESD